MRGPGFRYDNDVRRVWECPVCGQRIRTPGDRTTKRCPCKEGGILMRIVDEGVRRVFPVREKIVIPDDTAVPVEIAVEEPGVPLESLADAADSHFAEEAAHASDVEPADEMTPEESDGEGADEGGGEVHIEGLSVDDSTTGRRRREKNRRRHKQRREREQTAPPAPSVPVVPAESGSSTPAAPPAAVEQSAPVEPPTPVERRVELTPPPADDSSEDSFGANIFDH